MIRYRNVLTMTVTGVPVTAGHKRCICMHGHGVIVEGATNAAKKQVEQWRKKIVEAVQERYDGPTIDNPVHVSTVFYLPRPKSVKRLYPSVRYDLDTLHRPVFDAITTAKLWADDSRVVKLESRKEYTTAEGGAMWITIIELQEERNEPRGKFAKTATGHTPRLRI